jgi:NAD(P)-dependent dehydrogenase (short-subunit alcohol dehydrogenase family)
VRGFADRVCAVTGAGSGIGRALATGLARRGARLALSDVDEAGLSGTADQVRALGAAVHTARVDVADRAAVAGWAAAVARHHGVVHEVYNNAGIGTQVATLVDASYDDLERVIDVNMWGVVHGCKAFLPHLAASGAGHVVNISSLNGIMAQPGMTAYCMSKFAVRGLSEGLRAELLRDRVPVKVTVVHPGGVKTSIGALDEAELATLSAPARAQAVERHRIYQERLFTTTADEAARQILDGVARGRGRVLIGQAGRIDRIVRLVPAAYPRVVAVWDRRTFG